MVRNRTVEKPPAGGDRKDVADYVGAMSRDLGNLARRNGMGTLAYLLDMARLEAETIARGGGQEGLFRLTSGKEIDAS